MFFEKIEMFLLKLLIPQKLVFSTGTNILIDSDHSSVGSLYCSSVYLLLVRAWCVMLWSCFLPE